MPEQKELFFVGVLEPVQVRRQVLGCSKDVISILKRFERFKELRIEKIENTLKLKKLFEEINFLNNKLKQHLPKTKLRALGKEPQIIPQILVPQRMVVPRDTSTLDKLEQELMELEQKLDRLK